MGGAYFSSSNGAGKRWLHCFLTNDNFSALENLNYYYHYCYYYFYYYYYYYLFQYEEKLHKFVLKLRLTNHS